MSYEKQDGIPAQTGETVVRLDTGDLVAVACKRTIDGSWINFVATARAIDSAGDPILSAGVAIERALRHSDVDASRVDSVTKDCLLAVLGEPVATVAWGAQYLRDVSIRQALDLAKVSATELDPGGIL